MSTQISDDVLLDVHRRMVRIRHFEETAGRMVENGKIPGALHMYVGEEAVAAGVMAHLSDADYITSTHRGHGHLIAKGGDFRYMFAELFGKATGYCKGKGGSMHVSNLEIGMLGANGIVGGRHRPSPWAPPSPASSAKTKNVSISFFGDGASNEGSPSTKPPTWPALYKLPCVLHLREQRLRRVHAPGQPPGHRRCRRPGAGLRDAGRRGGRDGRRRRL